MAPSLLMRHPRYVALLAAATLYLLFPARPAPPTPLSLRAVLAREERLYADTLERRAEMVRRFPPERDMYTLWDFFPPAFNCPHHVERVGMLGDGGKWVCGLERIARQRECVIYSFGVNGESSFEAELLARAPGCQVWGYDFSVSSFGPEVADSPTLAPRAHFRPYALGAADAAQAHPPVFSLPALMAQNKHAFIDVLKIDIEGAEFASLAQFVSFFTDGAGAQHPHAPPPVNAPAAAWRDHRGAVVLPVGQLQVELHAREGAGRVDEFVQFLQWWEALEEAGMRPFSAEPNLVYVNMVRGARPDLVEYSFMNVRGEHALVADRV